ncbi:MAG TPA: hypothetical protein VIG64_00505 [Actinomycetota bacterium]|jgi:hypothetical protein
MPADEVDRASEARRPLLAAGIAILIAMLGTAVVVSYPPWTWGAASDRPLKVHFHYPRGWSVAHFENDLGLVTHTGTLVSNLDHDFRYPDLGPGSATSAWEMTGLPDDTVLVEISRAPRFAMPCRDTDRFPLPLSTAARSSNEPLYGAPRYYWLRGCIEDRPSFGVFVYLFPDAGARDALRAWQIVRSIRPSEP